MQETLTELNRPEPPPSKRAALFALVLLTGVFAVSVLYTPAAGDYFTICGFKNFTGLPCPGCGLTHAFCAVGKGEIMEGFAWNLVGPPLFALFGLMWARAVLVLAGWAKGAAAMDRLAGRLKLMRAVVIAFTVFGLGRIIYFALWRPEQIAGSALQNLIDRF